MPLIRGDADARASGQGVRCPAGRGLVLTANMGTIVKFPDEGRIVRFGRAETPEESATVIILPVIRIERHDQPHAEDAEPRTHPPADNGGRRRMRRR
jgi:hypothetical protein